MNIIPEKKYGKIRFINNMDILIKFIVDDFSEKKNNKIINIIFDNSLSTIGECFFNLKNGIKKIITLIPSDYMLGLYTNDNNIYYGNLNFIKIYESLDKVICKGFNNYKKYIDINLSNCILFTDEDLTFDNIKVVNDKNCLNLSFLNSTIENYTKNIGDFTLKLCPLNNNFIKKIYQYENFDSIKINNLVKNKEYNFLINMDILSIDQITNDVLEVKLVNNKDVILEHKLKMIFVNETNISNKEVYIQKVLIKGQNLENNIKKYYQEKNLNEIKTILNKLKLLYNIGNNYTLNKKYESVLNCIMYLEEEMKTENLKSIELNYEMKFNHFDLNK